MSLVQDFLDRARAVLAARLDDIADMQERRPIEADIDERRLHARQYPADTTEIDVADQAALAVALDVQFLHLAEIDHGDPGFLRRDVDEDFFGHKISKPTVFNNSEVSYRGSPMTPE